MIIDNTAYRGIVERIEEIRFSEGYQNVSQFTKTIHYSNPNYSRLLHQTNRKPSVELLKLIKIRFPKYCYDWIIDGIEPKFDSERSIPLGNSNFAGMIPEHDHDIISTQNSKIVELIERLNALETENIELKKALNEKDPSC